MRAWSREVRNMNDPNDWTQWPVTHWAVARYRRVDKVEFWVSVAVVAWYAFN